MDVFRKKGEMTKLMILRELVVNEPTSLRPISSELGITQQAVSEYLHRMSDEGLVIPGKGRDEGYRPTVKGFDFLQSNLLGMKEFVDSSISELEIVRSTDAVADGEIEKGTRVSLFMKGGLLYAAQGKEGPSVGTAEMDASPGDVIPVSSLEGVVRMDQGSLLILEIIPARNGGGDVIISGEEFQEKTGEALGSDPASGEIRTNPLDMEAMALLKRSGVGYHMEMCGAGPVDDALSRGLSVVAIGTPYSTSKLVESLERSEKGLIWKRGTVDRSGSLHI